MSTVSEEEAQKIENKIKNKKKNKIEEANKKNKWRLKKKKKGK